MDSDEQQYQIIVQALNNAISALNGNRQETDQRQQRRQSYLRNLFGNQEESGSHWCHACQAKVNPKKIDDGEVVCESCQGFTIEEIEEE